MKRVGLIDFIDHGIPASPFWFDSVLFDIPATVERAVRNAARAGAKAVTLHRLIPNSAKYACVMQACAELGLTIYTAAEPDFVRAPSY